MAHGKNNHVLLLSMPKNRVPSASVRCYLGLCTLQLNYLLHLPTTPHAKKVEVAGRLRNVIVDLAVSLGLQRSTILQQVKPPVLPLPMKTASNGSGLVDRGALLMMMLLLYVAIV